MSADEPGGSGDGAPAPDSSAQPTDGPKDDARAPEDGAGPAGTDGLSLRDTSDGFDNQADAALERGRRIFRPGIEAVVRGGEGQQVQIGNRYYQSFGTVAPEPGPVRPAVLTETRRRYAQVSGYPAMMGRLRERHLLLLSGAPATGRSTTALRLLDELGSGAVSRLDPTTDLRALGDDDFEEGRGYLCELVGHASNLADALVDRLADVLRRRECYLVLILSPEAARGDAFTGYGAECPPPDIAELLGHHLRAHLTASDEDDLEDTLIKLAESARIQEALGTAPRVLDAVELAGLLVAHGRRELAIEEVEDACRRFVDRQVEEWFVGLRVAARGEAAERERRTAAFRLAVAVLAEMPRGTLLQAAEDLGDLLSRIVQPNRTPSRELTAAPDSTALTASRVCADTRLFHYAGAGSVAAEVLKFCDDRYPQAVLGHVWRRHHNLRPPLTEWLRGLAVDDRGYARACAAQATGVLCWVDFPWTFEHLIGPAAATESSAEITSDEARWQRLFAARALDQAAVDARLHPLVVGLLRRWRRRGSRAERCTAALTLGYAIGHADLDDALVELRVLGTPQELDPGTGGDEAIYAEHGEVIWAAGTSLARLLATGAHHPVLDRLVRWTHHGQRRSVQLLALQTGLLLVGLRLRQLSQPQFVGGRDAALPARFAERLQWPLLLALLDDDPTIAEAVGQLLRFALRSRFRGSFSKQLGIWMRAAQDDPECVEVLASVIADLATDAEAGNREMLRDLVQRRGKAWADPLSSHVVGRLLAALDPVVERMMSS